MRLIKISADYAGQIKEYRDEFLEAGDSMDGCGSLRRIEDPYAYVQRSVDCEKEETMPAGLVPATQFMLVREEDNRLVGILQVRHYFNDYLSKYGGHIGYSIRPSERKKGYGKTMLKSALPFCREIGLDSVLITCYDDNVASERTILANGGEFESTIYEPNEGKIFKRFWIKL